MAKIIEITPEIISIGTDDGTIKEVRSGDINFVPHIGDKVEIFETDSKVIVSKVEEKSENTSTSGININLQNVQTNQTTQPTLVQSGKVVSKVAYCILAFFLGGIGIHKFYAGKSGAGITMLLFCWTGIPAIIALIDFIVGLTKKADVNGNIIV